MKKKTFTVLKRPSWDRRFFSETTWYTIGRFIFRPVRLPAIWRLILAHEQLHSLRQREMSTLIWMYKYFTDLSFVLSEEAKGIAVELYESQFPESHDWFQRHLAFYAERLTSDSYRKAAPSIEAAKEAIMKEYHELLQNNGIPAIK